MGDLTYKGSPFTTARTLAIIAFRAGLSWGPASAPPLPPMATDGPVLQFGANVPEPAPELPLAARLERMLRDRLTPTRSLLRRVAEELVAELATRPTAWQDTLPRALEEIDREQGWRAPIARLVASLRGLEEVRRVDGLQEATSTLALSELGRWLTSSSTDGAWSGRALAPGWRQPAFDPALRAAASRRPEAGTLLVAGVPSEVLLSALEDVLPPVRILLSPAGSTLPGREAAEALLAQGCSLTFVADAALPAEVARADAVWLGTEALGSEGFLAPTGTSTVLREAARREVPATLVTMSDQWAPQGQVRLPEWGQLEAWRLWEDAPPRIDLRAQPFEVVAWHPHLSIASDCGLQGHAEFAVSAMDVTDPHDCEASTPSQARS